MRYYHHTFLFTPDGKTLLSASFDHTVRYRRLRGFTALSETLSADALIISWIAASLINETESFLCWESNRDSIVRGEITP